MILKLTVWLSYLLLPFAVGQYVLRPMAYSFINLVNGIALKSLLLGGYLALTLALLLFMLWELWRTGQRVWIVILTTGFLAFNPYAFALRDVTLLGDLQRLDELNLDPSRYQVRRNGEVLELRGTVSLGMWQQAQRVLEANPQITRVDIQSPGGRVSPAIAIADQIRARNLDTQTQGRCFSACTLIFLAGQQRSIGDYAQLGFHAAFTPTASGQRIPSARVNQAIIQRFVANGVDPTFAQRAWTTPSDDLWLPNSDQLLAANYANSIL